MLVSTNFVLKDSDVNCESLAPPRANASFVTVVSGLPRSGTSLMMQMLSAGGLPSLNDHRRSADADNPKGYFEFKPASNIRADASWMPYGKGRVLKLVAQLLPYLPAEYEYRIVFMERSLDEVLASQKVMLDRNGRQGALLSTKRLRFVYQEQLRRVSEMLDARKLPVLRVFHHEVMKDPLGLAVQISKFLDIDLDQIAMAGAVDPTLHRQKSNLKLICKPDLIVRRINSAS